MERRSARGATGRSSAGGRGKGGAATPAGERGTPKSGGTSGKRQRKKTPTPPPPSLPPIPEGIEVVLQKNDWLVGQRKDTGRLYFGFATSGGQWIGFLTVTDDPVTYRVRSEIAAEIRRLVAFEKASLASRRTCNTSTNITPFTMQVTAPKIERDHIARSRKKVGMLPKSVTTNSSPCVTFDRYKVNIVTKPKRRKGKR